MQTNISYERNDRSRRDARKARAVLAAKPRYNGKQWTRQDTKRGV